MACRKNGKPIMNLSSSESQDESESEQPQQKIPLSHMPIGGPAKPTHNYQSMHSRKQFSTTMTLDDSRLTQTQELIHSLKTQNQHLQHQVSRLESENGQLRRHMHQEQELSQKATAQLGRQLEDAHKKTKKAQAELRKVEKECENKLRDREVTNHLRPDPIAKQVHSITQRVKQNCKSMLGELSKHKMTPVVEQIITKFVNELSLVNAENHKDSSHNKALVRPNHHFRQQPINPNPRPIAKDITEDYRMLQKSIEKLKTMEKDIGQAEGSYLRRQPLTEMSHNRTRTATCLLNQSTVSNLDRSKSRRKRIFNN